MEKNLKNKSVPAPKRRPTARQLRNGAIWLLIITYWQLVATPVAHFMILGAPYNRSILVDIGNAESWWDAFGSGWILIVSEIFGIYLTAVSLVALWGVALVATTLGEGIYRSLLRERPSADYDY